MQRGRQPKEAVEPIPKPAPQWKVLEVRSLQEALLQHGEGRTAATRQAVSAPSPAHAQDCPCAPTGFSFLHATRMILGKGLLKRILSALPCAR